jgi:hypothetical protein
MVPDFSARMARNKIVEIGGEKYIVRGITFEEFVRLGSSASEGKEGKAVIAELLQRCLVEPKLKFNQITMLDDKTLVTLVTIVLDTAKSRLDGIGFVSMPPDRGLPRDMIA